MTNVFIFNMADELQEDKSSISNENFDAKVCTFLDENVQDDLSNVRQCLERMENEKLELEEQLSSSNSTSAAVTTPSCVDKTLEDAKDALGNVDESQCSLNELNNSVEEHNGKVRVLVDQLQSLDATVKEVQSLTCYIKWIQKVEEISDLIHHGVEKGSLKEATEQLLCLKKLCDKLRGSSCQHLKKFVATTVSHWNKIVVDKVSKEFDEVLKVLKWPFTFGSTAPSLAANSEVFTRLENLFLMLLKLSEIECHSSEDEDDSLTCTNQQKEISLPMELLVRPLKKRFQFHFYGKRQTNNLEKPEWFFTQVLNWLRDHEDCLDSIIQPILNKAEAHWSSAQAQFTKGLLKIIELKMEQTIPLLLDNDAIFSHFIDETLLFDEQLRNAYSFLTDNGGCLSVLSQQPCFRKWVTLEKQYAMENVQALLSSEKAWSPRYQDAADVDDLKVPECAESFVSLLLGITDRYKNLPDENKRLAFVNIQLNLIFFFTANLDDVMGEHVEQPLGACFLFILNSTNYLATILQEWSEQTDFLKLYYTKKQIAKEKEEQRFDDHKLSLADEGEINQTSVSKKFDDKIEDGTLFDEAIEQLKILQSKLLCVLVKHVMTEFKTKSEPYNRESWHSLPSQKDLTITSLSPSLCDIMIYLREILGNLRQELVESLFTCFWKQLADDLSEFLFAEIIMKSHFNEGGATQMKFDIHKNLFILFGQFTPKPDNYFRKLKEAIILLNLMPGSAVLLKETVEEGSRKTVKETLSRVALEEIGVYRLSLNEVLNVLNSRINWTK